MSWKPPKINKTLAKQVAKVVDKHWTVTGVKNLNDIRDAVGKGVATPMSMRDRVDNQAAIKDWKKKLSKKDLVQIFRWVEEVKFGRSKIQYRTTDEAIAKLSSTKIASALVGLAKEVLAGEDDKCGEKGCIRKVGDRWGVMSGKTGEMWPTTYPSEESAKNALEAWHASRFKGASDDGIEVLKRVNLGDGVEATVSKVDGEKVVALEKGNSTISLDEAQAKKLKRLI
jgi:hypothetical protein